MEIAHWLDWRDPEAELPKGRIYLGEECCEKRLPAARTIEKYVARLKKNGNSLTFVTPFASDAGIEIISDIFDMLSGIFDSYEAVCNDWGVFSVAAAKRCCRPVVGRLLSRQSLDPRLARISDAAFQKNLEREVPHCDGTMVRLVHKAPPGSFISYIRKPSIIFEDALRFLGRMGASRVELNNTLHGIEMKLPGEWRASLHIPGVLISVKRYCRGCSIAEGGSSRMEGCAATPETLIHPSFPSPLYRIGNGVYCLNQKLPEIPEEMGIDRIVLREFNMATTPYPGHPDLE